MAGPRGGGGEPAPVSYIDDHHQRIHEFAQDYLDPEEVDEFVDSLLERHGYQRETHWAPPAPDDGQGGGGGRGGRRQPLVRPRQPARGGPRGGGQGSGDRGGSYFRR